MRLRIVITRAALCYAVLICSPSFAQKESVPGFYISMQGDTVKGVFHNYAQWRKNPSEVAFATSGRKPMKLTPRDCRKFVVEGYDEYLFYTGQRLVNPIDDDEVLNTGNGSFGDAPEEIVTFLRLVTRVPDFELYAFTDSKRTNFFYKRPGSEAVELKYKKYYDGTKLNTVTTYRDQLNDLFGEAIVRQKRTAALNTLPYKESALDQFLRALFAVEPIRQTRSKAAGWIVAAGASFNRINVEAATPFPLVAKEYRSSVSPLLMVGYLAPFRRNFGRYFIFPQLNLFNYKNTGEINDGTYKRVTTYQSNVAISGELDGGVNVINQRNRRLYFSAGVGVLTLLNNKRQDITYRNNPPSTEPYQSSQTRIDFETTPFVDASIGLLIRNKFLIESTYLFPTQIDDVINYTPRYSGLQLSIGLKLK